MYSCELQVLYTNKFSPTISILKPMAQSSHHLILLVVFSDSIHIVLSSIFLSLQGKRRAFKKEHSKPVWKFLFTVQSNMYVHTLHLNKICGSVVLYLNIVVFY